MVFRRDCRAADALAVCCAWLMQEPLGGFLLGHLVSVSCMWPGALPARILYRVRMAVCPSSVARSLSYALDSLNLPLN